MGITLLCQNYLTEISAHDNDKADFSAVAHTEFRPSLNVNTFLAENPLTSFATSRRHRSFRGFECWLSVLDPFTAGISTLANTFATADASFSRDGRLPVVGRRERGTSHS
jgi:hypothetical protein